MKKASMIGLLALLILALVFPLLVDTTTTGIAVFTLLYATAVTGWNLFSGYTGYISLGYASFTGIGAYTMALICDHWQIPGDYRTFLLLPVGGLMAVIFALLVGWISLRTRRVTFVVVTLAIMFILESLAFNLSGFTGGSSGIILPSSVWPGNFFNIPFYYVSLFLLVLAIAIAWWIRNSKYGLGLLAIREDEDRARGLGVKTVEFKLVAFVISAFLGGMVGAMFTFYNGNVFPDAAFDINIDVSVALMAFLGGIGTLTGPILGTFLLEPLQQYLTIQYGAVSLNLMILGALLLIIIMVLPDGIVTSAWKAWRKRAALRGTASPISSSVPEEETGVLLESSGGESG